MSEFILRSRDSKHIKSPNLSGITKGLNGYLVLTRDCVVFTENETVLGQLSNINSKVQVSNGGIVVPLNMVTHIEHIKLKVLFGIHQILKFSVNNGETYYFTVGLGKEHIAQEWVNEIKKLL